MAKREFDTLAPVEESTLTPAAEKRRPDPKPLQRAWGALGAATGSALLATIVGPMVASATGGFSIDAAVETDESGGSAESAEATPSYVYLAPGEVAPEGAPVVQLDPITVVTSPVPGSTVVQKTQKPKVVYVYLKPGEAPPAGAIVQQAGTVAVATPAPTTGGGNPPSGATPRPATPPPAAATPPPATTPPATPPPATPRPRPTPAPTPPPTRPSGG